MKLLVYGTLKSDGGLHHALKDAKLIERNYITTAQRYVMTSQTDGFPYIYEKENGVGFSVKGELYEVNEYQLASCNAIELGAGYELKEIDKDVFGYVYPYKIGTITNSINFDYKNRYWEWKNEEIFGN